MIGTVAPMGRPYRVSTNAIWPLRAPCGRTFAQRKRDEDAEARAKALGDVPNVVAQ